MDGGDKLHGHGPFHALRFESVEELPRVLWIDDCSEYKHHSFYRLLKPKISEHPLQTSLKVGPWLLSLSRHVVMVFPQLLEKELSELSQNHLVMQVLSGRPVSFLFHIWRWHLVIFRRILTGVAWRPCLLLFIDVWVIALLIQCARQDVVTIWLINNPLESSLS